MLLQIISIYYQGFKRFQSLVASKASEYESANSASGKKQIATSVVTEIRQEQGANGEQACFLSYELCKLPTRRPSSVPALNWKRPC